MSFKMLGGGSSLDTIVSDINQNILELKGREVTEVFKDETGVRRVLLGKGPGGFYGLLVSKPGIDVYTATADQLIFTSGNNVFKIISKLSIPLPAVSVATVAGEYGTFSGVSSVTPHGQALNPAHLAYFDPSGTAYSLLPYDDIYQNSGTSFTQIKYRIDTDDTNIYGVAKAFAFNDTVEIPGSTATIYLLQETAN